MMRGANRQASETGYDSPYENSQYILENRPVPGLRQSSQGSRGMRRPPPSTTESRLNGVVHQAASLPSNKKVGLRDRIKCYRWTWFLMNMGTGAIANVLFSVPFRSRWLTTIGIIFFLGNMLLFVMNCLFITLRFKFSPGSFVASFTDQMESLYSPAIVVSFAVILVNITQYGIPSSGPWLLKTMEVLFWVYIALCNIASVVIYLVLWSTQVFPLQTMTPVWVFPAYPLLLAAPFAGNLISSASTSGTTHLLNSRAVALCGIAVQATGFLISFMICAAFLYRLMTQKLPRDQQRPGVFISVGPAGFTVAGIVQLGSLAEEILPNDFLGVENAPKILKLLAYITGLCLWALCVWFFLISVGSLWKYVRTPEKMTFQMTWFSFIFPPSAMITATQQLGRAFDSYGLKMLGTVLTGCLVVVWILVFSSMILRILRHELLWPAEAPRQEK